MSQDGSVPRCGRSWAGTARRSGSLCSQLVEDLRSRMGHSSARCPAVPCRRRKMIRLVRTLWPRDRGQRKDRTEFVWEAFGDGCDAPRPIILHDLVPRVVGQMGNLIPLGRGRSDH